MSEYHGGHQQDPATHGGFKRHVYTRRGRFYDPTQDYTSVTCLVCGAPDPKFRGDPPASLWPSPEDEAAVEALAKARLFVIAEDWDSLDSEDRRWWLEDSRQVLAALRPDSPRDLE